MHEGREGDREQDGGQERVAAAEQFDRGGWAFKFDRGPDGARELVEEGIARAKR